MSKKLVSGLMLILAVVVGVVFGNLVIYHTEIWLYTTMFVLLIGITGLSAFLTKLPRLAVITGLLYWLAIFFGYEIIIGWIQFSRWGIAPDYFTATTTFIGMFVVGIPATMIASRLVIRRQPMAFWAYFACSSFAFYLLMAFVRYGSLHYRFMDIF